MKKNNAKKLTYWLLGETAGRTSVAAWKWLWGLPIESNDKIAQNVAQESVTSMQESISQLSEAVAKIISVYELAKQQYSLKQDELKQAKERAKIAKQKQDLESARLAIAKIIALEKILPQLSDRVVHAAGMMDKAKAKFKRETEKLAAYKLEVKNLETLAKVNSAMAEIQQLSSNFDLDSARLQFAQAKDSIEQTTLLETAKVELEETSLESKEAEIDLITLEAEIDRRLASLDSSTPDI